jgi:hypothetical protein
VGVGVASPAKTLASWRTFSVIHDQNSGILPNVPQSQIALFSNQSPTDLEVTLPGKYRKVDGTVLQGPITLSSGEYFFGFYQGPVDSEEPPVTPEINTIRRLNFKSYKNQ